jgi:acyl carrier protein
MEVTAQIDRATIQRELMAAIRVCMEAGGKECPSLTDETIPLKELEGFDSLCAIEVAVDLESKLDREYGEDLFVKTSGKTAEPRSLREIADMILAQTKRAKKGGREKHA